MVLRVMTLKQTVQALMKQHRGRFSVELGIDLSSGRSREIFRWFLASVLFGARISESIVKKTFREFDTRGIVSPKTVLDTGWDGLVEVLDHGGYVRYDFKTATKLLNLCRTLTENYGADLANLHAAATDPKDLEQRLKALAKGIGEVTVNIFLREMRGIWEKADPLPSDLAVMAAKDRGIVPKTVQDREQVLRHLMEAWKESGMKKKDFPDFEATLVRAGMEIRRRKQKGPALARC
jgi:endonuclease III